MMSIKLNNKRLLSLLAATFSVSLSAASFSVESLNEVPRLECDGKPMVQRLYMGNPIHLPTVSLALDAGIETYQISDYHIGWRDTPESEMLKFDRYLDNLLAANPKIKVIPRLHFEDVVPAFLKKHPEYLAREENGQPIYGYSKETPIGSIANDEYRAEMMYALRRTVRHLEQKYGDRIAGYHPSYGAGGEWQYWGGTVGYDEGSLVAFRKYLREKYKTDAELAKAWKIPNLTFERVSVPTGEGVGKDRSGEPGIAFLNPEKFQNAIDFNFFLSDMMASTLLETARVIREECGKRKLTCFFYGYTFENARNFGSPARTGEFALRKVLNSPDVDVFMGPFCYPPPIRAIGGGAGTHGPAESVLLAGKLYLNEDDNGTHLSVKDRIRNNFPLPDRSTHLGRTLDETLKIYRRNLAFGYIRNYAVWWMDLSGRKWQYDPKLWDEMRRFQPWEKMLMQNPIPYRPDVALIMDENSLKYLAISRAQWRMAEYCAYYMRDNVSRSSMTYGQYLLDDILDNKVPNAKLDIHCMTLALSQSQRKKLLERGKKIPSIWLWAPGVIDLSAQTISTAAMKELTGFDFVPVKPETLCVRSTPEGLALGLPEHFGTFAAESVVYGVTPAKNDIVLACYDDKDHTGPKAVGTPAVVYRPASDGRQATLFCGTNELPPALIRWMGEFGQAHIWSKENLHIQAKERFAAFTAPRAGTFAIDTGHNGEIRDVLTEKSLGRGPKLLHEFELGDTLIVEFIP